jgi:hypothetical protein
MNDRSTSDRVELGSQIGALELSSATVSITDDDGVLESAAASASAGRTWQHMPNGTGCFY